MSVPSVCVLVRSVGDGDALQECLRSLRAQTYPAGRFTIEVNRSITTCQSEYIALLDEHLHVDRDWLAALVAAAGERHAAAVSATILEADRRRVYFGGRDLSFLGFPSAPSTRDRVIYPCRESVLLDRQVFFDAGGFDESFHDCFEDIDLGWRLNVLGHTVAVSRDAVAYRGVKASMPPVSPLHHQRLLERNALAMIVKNYEDRSVARIFPAAVALSLFRGLTGSGIDSLRLDLATTPPERVPVSARLVAHLIGVEDFSGQLEQLKQQSLVIQRKRARSDAEVLPLFGDALRLDGDSRYQEVAGVLIRDFGIDELFEARAPKSTRVAVGRGFGDGDATRSPAPSSPEALPPKISVIILTALGPTHLKECLGSLRLQTYPAERVEVIVVDNGSSEDPTDEAVRAYPGARVILNRTNLGFAAGNNVGAAAATGDYVVFLNDDTRVVPGWLQEMVATAERHAASAVASCIVDWAGRRADFVEGAVNFEGKGFQVNYDVPMETLSLTEQSLLFGCGCALMIDRAVFRDTGGWDERTFAYYEDVELGWRLNLLGYSVRFSPKAVVYHWHHGTSGTWPEPPRLRLYERNSLRMLYALLDRTSLEAALPAALLLAADRALLNTVLSRAHDSAPARRVLASSKSALQARGITRQTPLSKAIFRLGVRGLLGVAREVLFPRRPEPGPRSAYALRTAPLPVDGERLESIPIAAAAALSGIFSFLSDLPELETRRSAIQGRRQMSDADVLKRFGSHWLQACPAPFQSEHDAVHASLVKYLGLADRLHFAQD